MTQQTEATTSAPNPSTANDGGQTDAVDTAAVIAAQPTGALAQPLPGASQAPETYEPFKLPDGMTIDDGALTAFAPVAKELGLSQDRAQKLVDLFASQQQSLVTTQAKQISDTVAEWAKQAQADKEYGGANFQANVQTAQLALGEFGSKEFGEFLRTSGLGNHPEMIRFCVNVGKQLQEIKNVRGDAAAPARSLEEVFYGKRNTAN